MDIKCIQGRKELPDMEEFKKVVVEMGRAVLTSEEMGFTFEIPD